MFIATRGMQSMLCRSALRAGGFLFFLILTASVAMAQPVAEFTANRTSGCAPLVVTFQDQSTGNPTSWNWGFGTGQLSSVQNPTITFSQPGTYSVQLVVQNADGTHGITKTDYITVYPSPSARFTSNLTIGCVPVGIQFTDQSVPNAGTITAWEWNFGDGTTSTQQNPRKTYTDVGFYTVSLKVTSSTGCTHTSSAPRYIRIVPGVTAEFSNAAPASCKPPFAVNFSNLTSGPGTMSYQWNFGNSATSTQTDPSTTYNATGTYNVQLIARSEYGCSDTIVKPVDMTAFGTAINAPDSACINSTVTFLNGSTPPPVSATWDFGNGVQSTNTDDATSYTTPGDYTVKLVNDFGSCKDSVVKILKVLPKPTVDFSAPQATACQAPFTVNFQDISPDAVAWLWNFGDGNTSTDQNPVHTYQQEGEFDVTLTITSSAGCQNTITKTAYIRIIKPEIRINGAPTGGCVPFRYDASAVVNAIDGVSNWFWDFGDGFTSTLPNPPPHDYLNPGNYTLKLRITTNGGCTDSLVIPNGIRTGTPPVVNFSMSETDVCAGAPVSFTDLSTPPVDEWRWSFGDGNISIQQNPIHQFTDTGVLEVRLTAYNNKCAATTTAQLIHVKPPVAGFSFDVSCTNKLQVNFTDTSKTDASYGPISYLWDFGVPGATSTTAGNVSYTYPGLGDYTVRLTVTNGSCAMTTSQLVRLVSDIADFTVSKTTVCRNEQFTVTAANSDPNNIERYFWSLNGGAWTMGGRSMNFSFPTNGTYSIGLRIEDVNGCTDDTTMSNAITVIGPTAHFTAANPGACNNNAIAFNDLTTPAGSIVQWTWDFGDGSGPQVMTAPPFSHVYSDTGRYVVRLTVRDQMGCTSSYRLPDTIVITRPLAGFRAAYDTICPETPLQFTDTSQGIINAWHWDFGDGNTSADQHPVHEYAGTDSAYTVKLVITDHVGCKDSVERIRYITTRTPKPAFTVADTTTICPPIETKFTFLGQDYESFYWDFGDGNTSTLRNPSNFYNTYGSYTAKLYLSGYGGCLDSAMATVNVYDPRASTTINFSPDRACNELLVDFSLTTPPGTTFTFYFDDGTFDTTQRLSFQHFYSRPQDYFPALILEDSLECQVSIGAGGRFIEVIGALPLFGKDRRAFCDTGTVAFTNFTIAPNDPVVSRVWDFGDNTTSTDENPVHYYSAPGRYVVSHTVTTTQGCSNTRYDTVRVHGTPFASIDGDSIVCIDELLPLAGELNRPDTAITWAWTLGNGTSSADSATSVTYGSAGDYVITLVTANLLDCRDTVTKNVFVPPNPVITIDKEPTIVVGTGITLPVTYSENIDSYTWTPPTRLSCTDCPTPFANPQFTTTYKLRVEDIYGCETSRDITVTVICNHENYFVPNTFSPNGDGMNDIFAPRGRSIYRINSMKIFNRWGELIFEKRNFMANDRSTSGGWDGTHKGKPAQQDVYVYIIEFVCDNGAIIPHKGNVMLVR